MLITEVGALGDGVPAAALVAALGTGTLEAGAELLEHAARDTEKTRIPTTTEEYSRTLRMPGRYRFVAVVAAESGLFSAQFSSIQLRPTCPLLGSCGRSRSRGCRVRPRQVTPPASPLRRGGETAHRTGRTRRVGPAATLTTRHLIVVPDNVEGA
jgi:hypothetical protein